RLRALRGRGLARGRCGWRGRLRRRERRYGAGQRWQCRQHGAAQGGGGAAPAAGGLVFPLRARPGGEAGPAGWGGPRSPPPPLSGPVAADAPGWRLGRATKTIIDGAPTPSTPTPVKSYFLTTSSACRASSSRVPKVNSARLLSRRNHCPPRSSTFSVPV